MVTPNSTRRDFQNSADKFRPGVASLNLFARTLAMVYPDDSRDSEMPDAVFGN